MPEVRTINLPANRQPGVQAPGRRGTTETAQSSLPPTSFTASGLQTLASLPEVRGISLPANRQPGAEAPGTLKARMGGRRARSVRRCLLRPLHRPARRERQVAANVPCEGKVQCQDGSLMLYAGAKSPGVDRKRNWLPASGPFS